VNGGLPIACVYRQGLHLHRLSRDRQIDHHSQVQTWSRQFVHVNL